MTGRRRGPTGVSLAISALNTMIKIPGRPRWRPIDRSTSPTHRPRSERRQKGPFCGPIFRHVHAIKAHMVANIAARAPVPSSVGPRVRLACARPASHRLGARSRAGTKEPSGAGGSYRSAPDPLREVPVARPAAGGTSATARSNLPASRPSPPAEAVRHGRSPAFAVRRVPGSRPSVAVSGPSRRPGVQALRPC